MCTYANTQMHVKDMVELVNNFIFKWCEYYYRNNSVSYL